LLNPSLWNTWRALKYQAKWRSEWEVREWGEYFVVQVRIKKQYHKIVKITYEAVKVWCLVMYREEVEKIYDVN
jgi:hypothetical protein